MVLQTHAPVQRHSLRPITTAHLAQTMTLLNMNTTELMQKIEGELAANPALELVEGRYCPICRRRLRAETVCPRCVKSHKSDTAEPIVFISPPETTYRPSRSSNGHEEIIDDVFSAVTEDLPTYVLRQIAPELEVDERILAAHVLSSLDEDGLLMIPLVEVAQYHHTSLEKVRRVASLIQHAEPLGVGSSSTEEALLIQLDVLGESAPNSELAAKAITEGFDLLSRHQYGDLGRLLGISKNEAEKIAQFVGENLNPFPARAHWGTVRHRSDSVAERYHKPDVIIRRENDSPTTRLVVEIMWPIAGILRVNSLFKKALSEAPTDKIEQWKSDIERANLLVKCLSQRNHTLVRLMERLAVIQREYILHGDAHMQPITRAQLADELEVHESTVSRAVAGKSALLPSGQIVPIAQFFDRSLHIRTALKKIIEEETVPLSDTKITQQLSKLGFKIARRTVAKYRSMEGILPAHLRHSAAYKA